MKGIKSIIAIIITALTAMEPNYVQTIHASARNCFDGRTSLLLGACAILIAYHYYFSRNNSSKTEQKNATGNMPPEGPGFADFIPEGIRAQNQASLISKYGNIFTVPSPLPGVAPNLVVVNEPQLVKELCIRQANMYRNPSNFTTRSDFFAKVTRRVVGKGVTGLKGDEWYWRKKALLKEFHRNRLLSDDRGLLSVIVEEGKIMCEKLGKAADSGVPVIADLLATKATVGVVLFFLFGRRLDFDAEQMRTSAKDLIDCLFEQIGNPFYALSKYFPGTAAYETEQKLKNAQKVIDLVVAKEIAVLLEEHHGRKSVHPDRVPGSVMASLIANEPRFQTGGIKSMLSEARVFVQAGFETTAHSLAFAMGMMAERPDLADEMAKQGMSILGKDCYYNFKKMKLGIEKVSLVNNFFHEALRLYPLAPSLAGECTNDIDIVTQDGKKYTLPRSTSIIFFNFTLQRKVPDPDEIRLDRWDAPAREQPFLHTFQNGPHACPGKPLSVLEARVFLLLVAIQFEFEFPKDVHKVEFDDGGLLRPKNGMPLLVKRRVQ